MAGRTFYPPGHTAGFLNGPGTPIRYPIKSASTEPVQKPKWARSAALTQDPMIMKPIRVSSTAGESSQLVSSALGRVDRDGAIKAKLGQNHWVGESDRARRRAVDVAKQKILAAVEEKKRPSKRNARNPVGVFTALSS